MSARLPDEILTESATNRRQRWDGRLHTELVHLARSTGQRLAYDPAQNGWVHADAPDADDDPDLPIWACLSRLVLRPWRTDDLDHYHAMLDDADLWRYMTEDMPTPFSKAVAADLIAISNAGHHHEVRAIQTPHGVVGQVRLLWTGSDLQPGEAEISYWLGNAYRGRGWAWEAVRQMTQAAMRSRTGLQRVVAYVHPDNVASARVLIRAGYEPSRPRTADGWMGFSCARQTV